MEKPFCLAGCCPGNGRIVEGDPGAEGVGSLPPFTCALIAADRIALRTAPERA